jgi:hypothetical protein
VPYPTLVRFGANGRYVTFQVSAPGIQCSNTIFGDPIRGTPKHCDFQLFASGNAPPQPTAIYCAPEGGFCGFAGGGWVEYGAGSEVTSGFFTGGTRCSNDVFGDPAPGQRKACYLLSGG